MTPPPDTEPKRPWLGRALVLALAAGAGLRLYGYFVNPSLSVDEAMLAVSVASRSFGGLLHPLWYDQIAPPLFLWMERLAVLVGGVNEPALRFVPLLSGLLLPYAVWRVARRLVPDSWALLAAAFAALSPILILYAVTAKPYATDALVSTLLVRLTLDVVDAPARRGPWLRLGAGGTLALAFSLPAAFVLAGSGLALLLSRTVRSTSRATGRAGAVAVAWAVMFGLLYATIFRNPAGSGYMQAFWAQRFLRPAVLVHPARAWSILRWFTAEAFVADRPLDWMPPLTWLAAAGGVWHFVRRDAARATAVAGPLAALLAASVLGRYPIAPRVCLFAAPLLFVLFVSGGAALRERWPGPGVRGTITAAVALFLGGSGVLVARDWHGLLPPPARDLVRALESVRRAGQTVYVLTGAVPTWTMYSTDWRGGAALDRTRLEGILRSQSPTGAAFHNAAGRGGSVPDTAGGTLVFRDPLGAEVIGLALGMQWREGSGFSQPRPDARWATREAARIREATDGTGPAWLVLTHLYPNEVPPLVHALAAMQGKPAVVWSAAEGVAALYRIDFAERRGR